MTKQIRAASYSRFSSKGQRESSITDQQRNTRERAKREGWRLVAEFKDEAISGSDDQRPGYRAMIRAAERREFEILLLEDLSRLTRDSLEQERLIRKLEFAGLRIVTCGDGYDSAQPKQARKAIRAMKGMQNEMFLDALADAVHRGQRGQALQGRWNGGRPYGYRLKPLLDPSRLDPYGQPLKVGTVLEIEPKQAKVVAEIFKRWVAGESCGMIARSLNARGEPSPGSSWRKEKRRCRAWVASAIRVILRNPLMTGQQRWNTHAFVRDPETKKHLRRARPEHEHVVHQIEALRIVDDTTFAKAQARFSTLAEGDARRKGGGKSRFLLSGLMRCGKCGSHLIMGDNRAYVCGGFRGGGCDQNHRLPRLAVEQIILAPIHEQLLDPARVKRLVKEAEAEWAKRQRAKGAVDQPAELAAVEARIERLRRRLAEGDPDLEEADLRAALARAEGERRSLLSERVRRPGAEIMALLPKAAEAYRRQLARGLDGDPEKAAHARELLRALLGEIRVEANGEGVWAIFDMRPSALIQTGSGGRGDRI